VAYPNRSMVGYVTCWISKTGEVLCLCGMAWVVGDVTMSYLKLRGRIQTLRCCHIRVLGFES
jgi:hypothetical protein